MRSIKSSFFRLFLPLLFACPIGHGLISAVKRGEKIIDFLKHSSFATTSLVFPYTQLMICIAMIIKIIYTPIMRTALLIITILSISFVNAFSLKDKIIKGKAGDYVITEQGGTSSVLLIRAINPAYLILEEIDVPSMNRKVEETSWKEWVAKGAPGYMAWTTYLIDLKTGRLQECYSHSPDCLTGMWLPTNDPHHFLPHLLSLPLEKTADEHRKRIGPPPAQGEIDRRSIWTPSVIVEGQKIQRPSMTAWQAKWPKDDSLLAGCSIELYFSSLAFPVWIEVRSPHYKVSLRAIDSGHEMESPHPLVFQNSPLVLGPGIWKKDRLELLIQCPLYYSSLTVFAMDLSEPAHPLTEIFQSSSIESPNLTLQIPEKNLQQNLIPGHRYQWVLISPAYPSVVIYSSQVFQW